MRHLLGEHQVAVVVAALAAVLLGIREAEEAKLAHAPEHRVGEGRLLPLLRVRGELLTTNARIDWRSWSCSSVKMKCLRLGGVVGLEQRVSGGHGASQASRASRKSKQ